jgi:hypothetical protein
MRWMFAGATRSEGGRWVEIGSLKPTREVCLDFILSIPFSLIRILFLASRIFFEIDHKAWLLQTSDLPSGKVR